MGANDSKLQEKDYKSFMDKFNDRGKKNDKLYGEGHLLQDKISKAEIFVKEYTANDESNFKSNMKKFEERSKFRHPNLIETKGYTSKTENQFCSTIFKTYLLFEYCSKNLEAEIINRRIDNMRSFTVEELWRMFDNYISGLCFLQENKLSHGDVKPQTLLVTNNGNFKVAEQSLLNPNSSYAQLLSNTQRELRGVFISPALLKGLENSSYKPKHSAYKSDVFSLGVSLLNAALLEPCDDIYNFSKFIMNEDVLDERIERMKIIYPLEIVSVIAQMLVLDEKNRMDFISLKAFCEAQRQKWAASSPDSPIQSQIQPNYQAHPPFDSNWNGNNRSEPLHQIEISPEKAQSKPASNFESPLFNQEPTNEPNYRFDYMDPVPLKEANQQQPAYQYVESYSSFQPKTEYVVTSNEAIKRAAFPPPTISNPPPATNPTIISSVVTPAKINDDYKDYNVNYDDINSLLKKYGIEPLQTTNLTSTSHTTTTTYQAPNYSEQKVVISQTYQSPPPPPTTVIYQKYEPEIRKEIEPQPQLYSEKPATLTQTYERREIHDPNLNYNSPSYPQQNQPFFSNYSEILRQFDNKEEIKRSGAGAQPPITTKYEEISKTTILPPNSKPLNPLNVNPSYNNGFQGYNPSSNVYEEVKRSSQPIYEDKKAGLPPLFGGESNFGIAYGNDYGVPERKNLGGNEQKLRPKEIIIENYQNGARYEGEKVNNMRQGFGKFYYADGGVYEGEWYQNRMYGKGTLYYVSGKIAYEGNWVDDKFEGQGILYTEAPMIFDREFDYREFENVDDYCLRYEGGFHEDDKDGYGILFLTNGEKFVGYFKGDKCEGRGMFYRKNGELVSGVWKENRLISVD